MWKLYGDSLRKDTGFTKVVKKVTHHNLWLLEKHAGRCAPEIEALPMPLQYRHTPSWMCPVPPVQQGLTLSLVSTLTMALA